MPSLRACWRNAPTVRFISLEILATGVRALECFRNSACNAFVHAARFRFFVFLANLITPGLFEEGARFIIKEYLRVPCHITI